MEMNRGPHKTQKRSFGRRIWGFFIPSQQHKRKSQVRSKMGAAKQRGFVTRVKRLFVSRSRRSKIGPLDGAVAELITPPGTGPTAQEQPNNGPSAQLQSEATEEGAEHTKSVPGATKGALVSEIAKYKQDIKIYDGYVVQTAERREYPTKVLERLRWDQERKIGAGGAGSVWLMKKERGGNLWAVKATSRDSVERKGLEDPGFSEELLAMIRLEGYDHLFVKFFGWYEDKMNTFIIMEYLELGDLGRYIADDYECARSNAQEITKQILEGLERLHKEAICHRDLKPQNILIASRDPIWVKIADFGISKRTKDTLLKTKVGTTRYLAPEILGALPLVGSDTQITFTNALDIWSLGVLVHELLTARTPFARSGNDITLGTEVISGLLPELQTDTQIDMHSLVEYCNGSKNVPIGILQESKLSSEGIEFVISMLNPNPDDRPTASSLLQNPWLEEGCAYRSEWYERLRHELLELGEPLNFGTEEKYLRRQARAVDILPYLPASVEERIPSLLLTAAEKGFNIAILKLLESPSRGKIDSSALGRLFQVAIKVPKHETIKTLLHSKACTGARIHGLTVLQWAAQEGHADAVKVFFDCQVDIGTSERLKSFHLAVESRHEAVMRVMLDHRVDIDGRNDRGFTPLQAAAENGHIDIVKFLLDAGAKLNHRAERIGGRTALQAAAEGGHIDIVELLLRAGAEVDGEAAEVNGQTALEAASGGGHIEVVKLLLDSGARVNTRRRNGSRTVLQAACQSGSIEIIKLILDSGADLDDRVGWKNRITLQAAARGGKIDIFELLFNAGASVYTGSILQEAVQGGSPEIVKYLLDSGADVNALDSCNSDEFYDTYDWDYSEFHDKLFKETDLESDDHSLRTALGVAAGIGRKDILELLLNAGADPDRDLTALQAAARGGYVEIIKLLLGVGAKVDSKSFEYGGRTALQEAVLGGHANIVNLLIHAGADVNTISNEYRAQTALRAAAERGDGDIVKLLLDAGADLNALSSQYRSPTALQAAAEGGYIDVFKFLFGLGAEVNGQSEYGSQSVFQAAARGGHVEIVKFLLNAGVNVKGHVDGKGGQKVLEIAAERGDRYIVKLMLDAGADINARPMAPGRIPLEAAASGGHFDLVKFLLDAGADANAQGTSVHLYKTALQEAARGGYTNIARLLLDAGADVNTIPDQDGSRTALQAAAEGGYIETVKFLVDAGASLNAHSGKNTGRTALQAACAKGHIEVVKFLVDVGADVNVVSGQSGPRTALQAAAGGGNIDIVRCLFNAGANVNIEAAKDHGRTALQAASERGHLETAMFLIKAGADLNAPASKEAGRTALQAAAARGHIDIVKLLLDAGADINARTKNINGRTALKVAVARGQRDIVKALLSAGADVNDKAESVVIRAPYRAEHKKNDPGVPKAMSKYLFNDPSADPLEHRGRTALQEAAEHGYIDIVEILLNAGADINAEPARDRGRTALQAAAEKGHIDVVEFLLESGADLNAKPCKGRGRTALQAAAEGGHIDVVRYLLDAGADLDAEAASHGGRTVLEAAAEEGHTEILNLLSSFGNGPNYQAGQRSGSGTSSSTSWEPPSSDGSDP